MNEEDNNEVEEKFLNELRRVLDYNPETGAMTRKTSISKRLKVGDTVGNVNVQGYFQIRFKNKVYLAHRLAWLLTFGKWPDEVIDHIDGNPLNNQISNLRDVSRSVNMQNQRNPHSNNRLRLLGVTPNKCGKFKAQIKVNDKKRYLGLFITAEEAHSVYLAEKRKIHEGCTI